MMKTNQLTIMMKTALVAFALQLGVIASTQAGGPAILQLPIEGLTAKNSDQCVKLFETKFASVLSSWDNGDVKMIKVGSTHFVQLRPELGHISLSDVEKALKGSPFSINREQLMYISVIQLRIGKIENHKKLVHALATLDGKKLTGYSRKHEDGTITITLFSPELNKAHEEAGLVHPLFSHKRLTGYLSKNKVKLISISWGNNHHRGAPFGARLATTAVVKKNR